MAFLRDCHDYSTFKTRLSLGAQTKNLYRQELERDPLRLPFLVNSAEVNLPT